MYFKKLKKIITDTILIFFQNVIYFCFAPPKKKGWDLTVKDYKKFFLEK